MGLRAFSAAYHDIMLPDMDTEGNMLLNIDCQCNRLSDMPENSAAMGIVLGYSIVKCNGVDEKIICNVG